MSKNAIIVDPRRREWWHIQALLDASDTQLANKPFGDVKSAQKWLSNRDRKDNTQLNLCVFGEGLILAQNPRTLTFMFYLKTLGIEAIAITAYGTSEANQLLRLQESGQISRLIYR